MPRRNASGGNAKMWEWQKSLYSFLSRNARPAKDYFRIPYRDTAHSPMSIWEFREARRRLEKQGIKEINEGLIFRSYEQMRSIEEQARTETKHIRRKSQQRRHNHDIYQPKAKDEKALSEREQSNSDEILPIVQPFDELEELSL